MFTDKQLEQLAKVIDTRLDAQLKPIKKQLTTIELNVEAYRAQSKQEHGEIMEKLTESNEINGKEQKTLKDRVDTIEHKLHISKN